MSLPVRSYTVEYRGLPADLGGAHAGSARQARGTSAKRRVEVLAASEVQALHRARGLCGGSEHRIVARGL